MHAAVAIPDERKGEQIALVTNATVANRAEFSARAKNHGVSGLAVPRHIVHVDAVPLLATGKPDFATASALALERLQPAETVIRVKRGTQD